MRKVLIVTAVAVLAAALGVGAAYGGSRLLETYRSDILQAVCGSDSPAPEMPWRLRGGGPQSGGRFPGGPGYRNADPDSAEKTQRTKPAESDRIGRRGPDGCVCEESSD
ncbi:MAG: hypothetical protein JW929_06590 [Anaerolineales bacterium]|nr:hypothetical protein [Anaerolineales bacterium]